jgi:serine/threonine protein kinase
MQTSNKKKDLTWVFLKEKKVATGTFSTVWMSTLPAQFGDPERVVAVKKKFFQKKHKNRERAILKDMDHTNVIKMEHAFFTEGDKPAESVLNIVMEFIPMHIHRVNCFFHKLN